MGDFKKANDMGFHADGSLILSLPGFPIRLRPEVSFTRFNVKEVLRVIPVSFGLVF